MELPTTSQLKVRLGGHHFDAQLFGLAYLALEERGYTDGQMYRLALGADGALSRAEWIGRVALAQRALPFMSLKAGDVIKAGGKKFTVDSVEHENAVVNLRTGKGKALVSLMPHGPEPIKYVIASHSTAKVVDSWSKL